MKALALLISPSATRTYISYRISGQVVFTVLVVRRLTSDHFSRFVLSNHATVASRLQTFIIMRKIAPNVELSLPDKYLDTISEDYIHPAHDLHLAQ